MSYSARAEGLVNMVVCFTASVLWSPGLFSVFKLISAMLLLGWPRLFFRFLIPTIFFSKYFGVVSTTIDITITLVYFFFPVLWKVFAYFFAFCYRQITTKFTWWLVLFQLIDTMSGLLDGIKWFVCISKFQRILCTSFSMTDSCLCIYH